MIPAFRRQALKGRHNIKKGYSPFEKQERVQPFRKARKGTALSKSQLLTIIHATSPERAI